MAGRRSPSELDPPYSASNMSRHQKRLGDPLRYSLTQLEEVDWGPPDHPSSLVHAVHQLRNVPLKDMSMGDIRLLIGQSLLPRRLARGGHQHFALLLGRVFTS